MEDAGQAMKKQKSKVYSFITTIHIMELKISHKNQLDVLQDRNGNKDTKLLEHAFKYFK